MKHVTIKIVVEAQALIEDHLFHGVDKERSLKQNEVELAAQHFGYAGSVDEFLRNKKAHIENVRVYIRDETNTRAPAL